MATPVSSETALRSVASFFRSSAAAGARCGGGGSRLQRALGATRSLRRRSPAESCARSWRARRGRTRRCRDAAAPCRRTATSPRSRVSSYTRRASAKPGMTYGMYSTRLAEHLPDGLFAARRVGDGDDRVRMRVVDERERNQRVQDGFDRRRGRVRIGHGGLLDAHHVGVGQLLERGQLEQASPCAPARSLWLRWSPDPSRCPSRTAGARRSPNRFGVSHLDRGVAAAVKHQRRLSPSSRDV